MWKSKAKTGALGDPEHIRLRRRIETVNPGDKLRIMSNQHPNRSLLTAYASGRASDGVSLAVAAHLNYCPECRKTVRDLEKLAGVMIASEPATDAPSFDQMIELIDRQEKPAPIDTRIFAKGPLPTAVAEAIGCSFDDIPWKFRLPGVSEHEFKSDDGETVSLLRVRPGAAIPKHTHEAEELTVIFDGELHDGDQKFYPGDVAIADPSVDHHPRAGGDRPCICLAVLTGGLTFTGPFGRALNLFS